LNDKNWRRKATGNQWQNYFFFRILLFSHTCRFFTI
jgi:hypothetical protein